MSAKDEKSEFIKKETARLNVFVRDYESAQALAERNWARKNKGNNKKSDNGKKEGN